MKTLRGGCGILMLFYAAVAVGGTLNEAQDARYQHWVHELRCLVCQNQTIAESNAPLAADLRDQVQAQIAAGRSDDEIRAYLTARYGDFVLYNPPLAPRTWLLWVAPFALLALGLWTVLRFFSKTGTPR